jgi:hypothetical protein
VVVVVTMTLLLEIIEERRRRQQRQSQHFLMKMSTDKSCELRQGQLAHLLRRRV